MTSEEFLTSFFFSFTAETMIELPLFHVVQAYDLMELERLKMIMSSR